MTTVSVVHISPDDVGESPLWCPRRQRLLWIDIRGRAVRAYEPASGSVEVWPMPSRPGFLLPTDRGDFIVGLEEGLVTWSPEGATLVSLPHARNPSPGHRFNDGRADGSGRLWAGVMDPERAPTGSLCRLADSGALHPVLSGLTVPNTLAFFDEGRSLLFSDSVTGVVLAFDYASRDGRLGARRVFMEPGAAPGQPDGVCVDSDGMLWMARFGGGCVLRIDPKGSVIGRVDLPTMNVTSCAFGGADLDELYVTSATALLDENDRRLQPLAGALFCLKPGVRGRPEAPVALAADRDP